MILKNGSGYLGGTRGKERAGNFYIGNREFILNRYTSFYTEHKILPNFVLSFLEHY